MSPNSSRNPGSALYLALGLAATGCAPHGVPPNLPRSSVASPEGGEAAPARVTLALDEDPPLPGEVTEGWRGLRGDDDASKSAEHDHHGGH
jgi:hypothetical protein